MRESTRQMIHCYGRGRPTGCAPALRPVDLYSANTGERFKVFHALFAPRLVAAMSLVQPIYVVHWTHHGWANSHRQLWFS